MNQTLNITDEDLFATVAKVQQVQVVVEQGITARKFKIDYSKKKNVPYDCVVIILNDKILSGADKIEQGNEDKLQVKDVRALYRELNSHIQKGSVLRQEVKNRNEYQRKLEQDLQYNLEKVRQLEVDITKYQNNLQDLERQNLLLRQELEYTKSQFNEVQNGLQTQITQLQKQNEQQNNSISEAQLFLNQYQQKIQEDSQTIDGYNQYFTQLNQECQQIYGQQYQVGLLNFYKNELEQQLLQANQQIEILTNDKVQQEETINKNKTESDKKYRKLFTEKQTLEVEVQNLNDIIEKNQKKSNQQLQDINELKRKLKQAEEDLNQQIEAQGQNQEQQIQNLKEQNKQLIKQKNNLDNEIGALKQSEKDYKDLYGKETRKFEEQKKQNDANETQILQLTDQLNKREAELKKSEVIRQQVELKLDSLGKQNAIHQQQTQQQLNEYIGQIKSLKADINKLNEQIASQNKQIKDLEYKLADIEDLKKATEKRNENLVQQNLTQKTQINSLELEKQGLISQLSKETSELQKSRRELETLQQLSDKQIHDNQLEIDQLQNQIDQLQEKITWLIPKLPKNQHKPKILSLVETIRNSLPVLEDFVKNESGSFDDSAFIVYRINPVENLLKEVLQGKLLQDQKILILQELGEITAKRSINATTENSDYFRGFMLKVTHGLGELIDRLFVIRENKSGSPNFPTGEEAVVSAHNQFLAEYIFQQFNLFLHSKGRQQSDLKFPATYIFQKKGEQKFYLTEEIQEGPFEKYLGGELVIRNDNDDAKFSNALALFSYYKSKKSMMLSNLQTLNRVYHDTIVCTKIGQLTNYDQGLDEIHLIINQLGAKGDDFIDPFIVRDDEV